MSSKGSLFITERSRFYNKDWENKCGITDLEEEYMQDDEAGGYNPSSIAEIDPRFDYNDYIEDY